jgi:hypothetical protein
VHPLYQRLKELDSDTFEKLCFHLVKTRFPGAEIRHVDGAAGDEGLDLFLGLLDAGPTVWQCKSFPNGVRKHQREQIRASIKRALKHGPRRWVLCLSVDMDAGAHRWFQRMKSSYAGRVDIGLMQACDIVQELFYRTTIREMFFPHAVFDLSAFRETVARTGRLSMEDLADLNAENIDQYLKRLEDADARFAYSVTYGRNLRPDTISRPQPGLIASISDDTKTINVFARDVEALRLNPPKGQFTITGTGVDKFNDFIRSGRPQLIGPEELLDFTSDFGFLGPLKIQLQGAKLFIGPSSDGLPPRLTRVTFGSGADAVVYECIKLECTRHGREEAELESSGTLPFRMSLIVNFSGTGSVHFKRRGGADIRAVQKFIRGLKAMYQSGELELYDLEQAATFLKPRISGKLPAWFSSYDLLVNDAVAVADFYGVDLKMPEIPTRDDLVSLAFLKRLIEGLTLTVNDLTLELIKAADIGAAQAEPMRGEGAYLVRVPEYVTRPVLFGVPVCTGPVAYHIPRARVENPDEVCKFFQTAAIGESIKLSLKPLCPIQARAFRPDTPVLA